MTENKKPSQKRSKHATDDAPPLTARWFAEADLFDGNRLQRPGRPKGSGTKELISLRLDREAIAAFRATGRNWQSRINEAVVKSAKRISTPADLARFDQLMARDGGQPPVPGDELPKGYRKTK